MRVNDSYFCFLLLRVVETKTTSDKRLDELYETIDISTIAFKNMNDSLHESTKEESEIDLKVMKEMMRKDGLMDLYKRQGKYQ